jgi:hypothetical protein
MVVKASFVNVPEAADIDGKVSRLNQRVVARANQGVGGENAHEDADAKDVIGVEAATVGGNGFVIIHPAILEARHSSMAFGRASRMNRSSLRHCIIASSLRTK